MVLVKVIDSVISLLDKFQQVKHHAKREVIIEVNRLKRKIAIKIFQTFLYCVAISLVLASAITFFTRFFALDAVLLGTGLIVIYVAMMIKMYNK